MAHPGLVGVRLGRVSEYGDLDGDGSGFFGLVHLERGVFEVHGSVEDDRTW